MHFFEFGSPTIGLTMLIPHVKPGHYFDDEVFPFKNPSSNRNMGAYVQGMGAKKLVIRPY